MSANKDKMLSYIIPKKLLITSAVYQVCIGLPLVSFFSLLMLGILEEPERYAPLSVMQRITILSMWAALFSGAAFFSCLGSLVSYSSRGNIDDRYIQDGSFALSMHIVGSVFGMILLLLFIGGFVAGNLFPNFNDVGFYRIYWGFSSTEGWARLFVWAFIAGFSERLMPNLLENVARRIEKSKET